AGDGCRALRQMIADSHETPARKKALRRRGWQLFRALLDRKIIDWIPPQPSGRKLRVNVELQDDFSLHQALLLYLIDTLPLLDRGSERKTCGRSRSRARCSSVISPLPNTCATMDSSGARGCSCVIARRSGKSSARRCPSRRRPTN